MHKPKTTRVIQAVVTVLVFPVAVLAIGQTPYVEFTEAQGSFPLAQGEDLATLFVDAQDHAGVVRAARDLQADIARVTSRTPELMHQLTSPCDNAVLVGTIGKSAILDRLIREGKIDVSPIAGKWESFLIQVVPEPLPGVANGLVIAGSDKRGTIFGIYDLSEQIGVSPWYWWADVPVEQCEALFIKAGRYIEGPPAVQYRGIFLNDEAPALSGWVHEKFGNYNHPFYTKVFELILRMKGNFLWPAMWNNSFNTDDPLNPKLADEYGIVMSTSHHEPMTRAWKEWGRLGNPPGSWDYSKNPEALRAFWTEGIERTKDYEKIITLAMRGDGDEPMSQGANIALLERIVANQREIIAEIIDPNLAMVPQVWALYKEVQGYYEKGMRVPDDVILLWCDDNWGNLRRLPTAQERKRPGGAGIYYHFDYVGGPRCYRWINTVPITKVWEQMNLAWRYDANRIWVVNVGDLKPMEFPIEFFLTLAWDPQRWPKERLHDYTLAWARREFGPTHASEIADVVARYTKYNGRRKPELIDPTTFHLVNYSEADRVLAEWKAIVAKAERIYEALPDNARDAFFQLVLHPTKASALVTELYITAGRNRLYAEQKRASTNDLAQRVRDLFQRDADLSRYYNQEMAGGKWNHMMDQTHIGYTNWQEPRRNNMPAVKEIDVPEPAEMAIAVEGSASAWPGASDDPALSVFDAFHRQKRYIDVFNRGQMPFEFEATPSAPWIELSTTEGTVASEQRIWVGVDWDKAPKGSASASVKIARDRGQPITIAVKVFNPAEPTRDSLEGFVEANGYVSMEAEHYTKKTDAGPVRWEKIEDYGLTGASMTIFPITAESVEPSQHSPCLEYRMYLFSARAVEVTLTLAPSLNFMPDRGVRFAVSFDDEAPQVLTVVPQGYFVDNGNRDWEASVRDNCRRIKSTHTIDEPGYHTLKVWMVDPAVVLQKIVIDTGGLKPSYLGPPESYRGN